MGEIVPLFLPVGSRVRVRPKSDAAAMIEGSSDVGTVISSVLDESGGPAHVAIALDGGGYVTSSTMADWEIISGSTAAVALRQGSESRPAEAETVLSLQCRWTMRSHTRFSEFFDPGTRRVKPSDNIRRSLSESKKAWL